MNANEPLDIKTIPDDSENHEIANMDEFDFLTLLMESRIIQASQIKQSPVLTLMNTGLFLGYATYKAAALWCDTTLGSHLPCWD